MRRRLSDWVYCLMLYSTVRSLGCAPLISCERCRQYASRDGWNVTWVDSVCPQRWRNACMGCERRFGAGGKRLIWALTNRPPKTGPPECEGRIRCWRDGCLVGVCSPARQPAAPRLATTRHVGRCQPVPRKVPEAAILVVIRDHALRVSIDWLAGAVAVAPQCLGRCGALSFCTDRL